MNQILYTNIMKKTTLLTLSLLMIIGITSAQQPQYEKAPNRYGWNELFLWGSGYTYESLYGDVQCIKIKGYDLSDSTVKFTEYYEFNESGNVIFMEIFAANDRDKLKFTGRQKFEYNGYGNIVKATSKDRMFATGPIMHATGIFEYNNNNRLIYERVDHKDGDGWSYRYLYDNNGNEILCCDFDSKNQLIEITIKTYDADNNLVCRCIYDGNHNLLSKCEYIYEYDDKGNVIKESTITAKNSITKSSISYDKKGNIIMTPTCILDKDTITSYTTYSYDNNNNLIEKIEFENDIISTHIAYYPDGNETIKEINDYDENGKLRLTWKYNIRGDKTESNLVLPQTYEYEYDSHNNVIKTTCYSCYNNGEVESTLCIEYDITYR